jgi:hypothetical protein
MAFCRDLGGDRLGERMDATVKHRAARIAFVSVAALLLLLVLAAALWHWPW